MLKSWTMSEGGANITSLRLRAIAASPISADPTLKASVVSFTDAGLR
jgi:hypothetical protein